MSKTIIIDIGHPAQVHNFKNVYYALLSSNWKIIVTLKNKEMASYLLDGLGIPHKDLLSNKSNFFLKILIQVLNVLHFTSICIRHKPHLILSRGSIHSVISSRVLKIPHIYLSDTEHAYDFSRFADVVLTNSSYRKDLGKKQIRFDSNIELFYLHPNYYISENLTPISNKYILFRFVSWNAHHDTDQKGLSIEQKIKAVKDLSYYGKIYISSEKKLPKHLEKYRITINPLNIHQFIENASLIYGESATMASEAAVLGVPSIYHDNIGRGYTDEEQQYGLCFNFPSSSEGYNEAIEKAKELLELDKDIFVKNKQKFINSKIDPVKFLVWFIEDFPNSIQIMKENPAYQYRFK